MIDRFNFYADGEYERGTLCDDGDYVHYDKYAELEALLQLHPASEPPESDRRVLLKIGGVTVCDGYGYLTAVYLRAHEIEQHGDSDEEGYYSETHGVYYCDTGWFYFDNMGEELIPLEDYVPKLGWCELPPLQEGI